MFAVHYESTDEMMNRWCKIGRRSYMELNHRCISLSL